MESNAENKKLWGGRFSESSSDITERISSSIQYDSRMYKQDIRGSIAHSGMLKKIGVLNEEDHAAIVSGLKDIEKEIKDGKFNFSTSLEDIHMNIEASLTERIGEAGKKLHTGRSRNDQVALDIRLYLRDEISEIKLLLKELITVLADKSQQNIDILIPGYTHMQVAQPVRFSQHLLAYAWKFVRDYNRLIASEKAADILPLGVGALAGVNYPNDREFLREELGFSDIVLNSMDAVSDRDFVLDFLYFSSVLGAHMSRFCEELVLWSTSEFNFIRLADGLTTGSSIMPQKRNPDIAELIRGKTGRLYGNLFALLTILKGLPMTYNRDLQEDKEPVFDSIDTVKLSIEGLTAMIKSMQINKERMRKSVFSNFSTATDLADYLACRGMPFRKSHEVVGNIVKFCEDENRDFFNLNLKDLKKFSEVFEEDIIESLNPETSTERKLSKGSTAKKEIVSQLEVLRQILEDI